MSERVETEDLTTFISTSLVATAQDEFRSDGESQAQAIAFLHQYVLGNYRRLYACCLAAGINDRARALIVQNLLTVGAPEDPVERAREGALIGAALKQLPPPRVYRLIAALRRANVNNRRTRATFAAWLKTRRWAFDAIKYRRHLRGAARYLHVALPDEVGRFLFEGPEAAQQWDDPLLNAFRRARYDARAIYELPLTIAEGLAQRRGIDERRFLETIAPSLSVAERGRVEQRLRRASARVDSMELSDLGLTRLCLYLLSRPVEERLTERERIEPALCRAARRVLGRTPAPPLRRVALVLDNSRSSVGSRAKRHRPLAVAWAVAILLREAADACSVHWTRPVDDPLALAPAGPTRLADPLLDALSSSPDLVIVVSDGYENDPPGAASEIVRVFRERLDSGRRTRFLHLNPAYDDCDYSPRALGPDVPTLGLRDAEQLPSVLGFARFVDGSASLNELQEHLLALADAMLGQSTEPGGAS